MIRTLCVIFLLTTVCSAQSFWNTERKAETTGLVAESILDGYTTQVMLNRGGTEHNPLARPLVTRGLAGQTAASALGVSLGVGVQYIMYRTGHRKAACWAGRIVISAEGINVGRQIYLWRKLQ